jgi:hypothetical protein
MNCIRCDIPEETLSKNGYCEHCFDLQDSVQIRIEAARNAWQTWIADKSTDKATAYSLAIGDLMEHTGWGIPKTTRIINERICA